MKVLNLLILFLLGSVLFAQDTIVNNHKTEKYYLNNLDRNWLIEIPVWIPGMTGQFAFGELSLTSSDESSDNESNFINNELGLQFFFIGRTSVHYKRLWGQFDAFSAKINTKLTIDSILFNNQKELLELNIHLTISRLNAGYRVYQYTNNKDFKIEVLPYVGLRFHNVKLEASLFDSLYAGNVNSHWFDPIVGLYIPILYKRWLFVAQADFGGFQSRSSWMLVGQVHYRLSKLMDIKLGWNYLDLNYKTEVNEKNLEFDLVLSGPTLGIGFRF